MSGELKSNNTLWLCEATLDDMILQRGDLPVGQVRVEHDAAKWKIDYSIDAAWRGHGYGR